jgi:hypothetical protein
LQSITPFREFVGPHDLATSVVTDLFNLLFDRVVVRGIAALGSDFDRRIRLFITEYIGTPDRPIGFGGRGEQLDRLDRWLRNPATPPYALVAGPAGRGKSALLVHWAQRLIGRDPTLAVAFFPISIRFRTNLAAVAFASLTARLALLRGEPLPAGLETPTEVWRELLASMLTRPLPEGVRLLVILDAADEAADWQPGPDLFPPQPVPGLKVLVSARTLAGDLGSRDWLERLGWHRSGQAQAIELAPLTLSGVAEVLHGMSVPLEALSRRIDIVAELYRLSEGDPLLVNLYAADLWTQGEAVARLRPEDLAAIEPGIDGYFRRWWDDQRVLWGPRSPLREPAVQETLNVLACALGPLLTSELLELMPDGRRVSVWELDDVLKSLSRFIVGDGVTHGYAFSHPRLGDHFYDRLHQAGQAAQIELRFVRWGRGAVEALAAGRIDVDEVPVYVLQYQRRHLERAHVEPAAFIALADNLWARGWERLDRGSYVGFLGISARPVRWPSARTGPPRCVTHRCRSWAWSCVRPRTGERRRHRAQSVNADAHRQCLDRCVDGGAGARLRGADRGTGGALATLIELSARLPEKDRPLGVAACVAELRGAAAAPAAALIEELFSRWARGERQSDSVGVRARRRWLPRSPGTGHEPDLTGPGQAGGGQRGAGARARKLLRLGIRRRGTAAHVGLRGSGRCRADSGKRRRVLACGHLARPAYESAGQRALRLNLLRQLTPSTADDDALLLTAALRSAAARSGREVARQRRHAAPGRAFPSLASAAHLPVEDRVRLLRSLPAALTRDELVPLLNLEDPSPAAVETQIRSLLHWARHRDGAPEGWVGETLERVLCRPSVSSSALMAALAEGADLLTSDRRVEAIDRVTLATEPAALIVWLGRCKPCLGSMGHRSDVPRRAFDAARALVGRPAALTALASVLDLLSPPEEVDSFEASDQDPNGPLRRPLRRLLRDGRITRAELRALAEQLAGPAARIGTPWRPQAAEGSVHAAVHARLAALADATPLTAAHDAALNARTTELVAKHYDGSLQVDDLTEGLFAYGHGAGRRSSTGSRHARAGLALDRWRGHRGGVLRGSDGWRTGHPRCAAAD